MAATAWITLYPLEWLIELMEVRTPARLINHYSTVSKQVLSICRVRVRLTCMTSFLRLSSAGDAAVHPVPRAHRRLRRPQLLPQLHTGGKPCAVRDVMVRKHTQEYNEYLRNMLLHND